MEINKAQARHRLKALWSSIEDLQAKEMAVLKNLEEFLVQNLDNNSWCLAYKSLPNEVSLERLFVKKWSFRFCFPRVVGDELKIYQPGLLGFESAYAGIWEPIIDGARSVGWMDLKMCLVPGVGFSWKGQRLGRGKGFYDRALKKSAGVKVGVSLFELVQDELPTEEHDIKMNFLITDKGVHKF